VFYALAFFLLWTAGAGAAEPVSVVTTSPDLKALVEAVGGERVRVESLAAPLQDPHAVEVKPGQLVKLRSAALLVRIGLDHEPWLGRALRTVGSSRFTRDSPHYLDTSKGIQLLQSETPRLRADKGTHLHGFGNPHFWLDPENGRPITAAILETLARLAPGDRLYFEANRKRFLDELDSRLKIWLRTMASHKGTRAVAVHETWPYFAQRFGLVIVAVVEPNPGVPPAPSDLANLIKKMRDSGVRLVIADPYSNESLVRRLATQTSATAVTLIPSVGGDPAVADYLSLFEFNIQRLSQAATATR
jgi:ABC-type Zn uptake system ZnuABC Zn-binding protein ZnuA